MNSMNSMIIQKVINMDYLFSGCTMMHNDAQFRISEFYSMLLLTRLCNKLEKVNPSSFQTLIGQIYNS